MLHILHVDHSLADILHWNNLQINSGRHINNQIHPSLKQRFKYFVNTMLIYVSKDVT
jgi:hypothetical protein